LSRGTFAVSPYEVRHLQRDLSRLVDRGHLRLREEAGYDCVEIAPFTIAKSVTDIPGSERTRIKEMAAHIGIGISGIHWVLVQTEGLYLTHPDAAVREKTARYFVDLVDFCADLGGTRIVVGSPKQRNLLPGVGADEAWKLATEVFRPSIKHAEQRGVVICFEPLAPSETDFVNTAAEAIRFARQFGSPAMSVILDVKAMSSEGRPIPEIIRESTGQFSYFHAKRSEPERSRVWGDGLRADRGSASRCGLRGRHSVEVFKFEEGPEVIASKSIEYLRKVFARA
jgi:sugar phosphate isomerase/epimerase